MILWNRIDYPVDGETYTAADSSNTNKLLPTWKAFASYTKTQIIDASDYSQKTDNRVWTAVASGDTIMSQTDSTQNVDLIYNLTSNFKNNTSKLTDLTPYINNGSMPHFKAWLEANPTIQKEITLSDGGIYYTPYFDGYNDIERMFIMDTSMTTKVLDSETGWDTTTTNGGSNPSSNVLQGGYYTPYVDPDYNYPDDLTKVPVLYDNSVGYINIYQTKNIIKQQNELLANGCTGYELAQQFINYIKTAYKEAFEFGYYEKTSDLFISDSAAYNADELVALMRVVKANPGMITGDAGAEIETFFPRAASNNRIENVYDLAQIWGIQGVDGEQNNFYFGGDGKIHSLETTQASYDALIYLSEMYDEGLILGDFYTNERGIADSVGFLEKYYKKTAENSGYGFMMYDYSAATTAANDTVDGIGTNPSVRADKFQNTSITSISPVLVPLAYWGTESNWSYTESVTDKTGKTLCRYYESNRALKSNTWAIPVNSDNVDGAVRLMDFMFSEFGQDINSFGPTEYWAKPNTSMGDTINGSPTASIDSSKAYVCTNLVAGENTPILSSQLKSLLTDSNLDFWTFMRNNLGATHGIGHVRSKSLNLQTTNVYGQAGLARIQQAYSTNEVLYLAQYDKGSEYTWNTCVPTGYVSSYVDNDYTYGSLTGFWQPRKFGCNQGWVNVVTSPYTTLPTDYVIYDAQNNATDYATVLNQLDTFNKYALYTYAYSVGSQYVPSYALSD